jgi:hypothetical protein
MTRVRWIVAVVSVATACSSSSSSQAPAGDAGRDVRRAPDAHPADAHRADGRPSDAHRADARTTDARRDGRGGDAGPVDATTNEPDVAVPAGTMISVSPLAMTPPFSTTVHDYYVTCSAGTNTLTVSMTTAPGSTISLQQPTTTPPATSTTTTVDVQENQALVVGVTTSGETAPYWIRCLPHDFPNLQMILHPEAGTPTPGYYLLSGFSPMNGDGDYAIMLDTNGVPVWYHATLGGFGGANVDDIIPGTISWMPYRITPYFAPIAANYELHHLAAGTTTYLEPSGTPFDMHELRLLPNGDYLVLTAPISTGVDLSGLMSYGTDEQMFECDIEEVAPDGSVVWQWSASDHFDPAIDSTWPLSFSVDGGMVVDTYHCNSIDVDPDGNLLVSARHMDSIFLISKATGAVIWKMGGSSYSKDDTTYITVTNDPLTSFYRQHDARLQPNGQVSLYDDQTDLPTEARAVVYAYSVDAGTASPVWQYLGQATSASMGSFRILDDGSRTIGWGVSQQPLVFSEVDESGNDLLDFSFANGEATYRAIKIPTTAFDINLLRATAGLNPTDSDSGP